MATPLTLVTISLEAADSARTAFPDAGFARDDFGLTVHDDEAGPFEGNFVPGNGRDATRGLADPLAHPPYDKNFRRAAQRGIKRPSVAVRDASRRREAARMAERFGGRAVP